MILDYVDEGYPLPAREMLESGDVVYQTRRSIDLEKEVRNYNPLEVTPRFIVIGSQVISTLIKSFHSCVTCSNVWI